jgi:Protein of unknown function (DUF4232)
VTRRRRRTGLLIVAGALVVVGTGTWIGLWASRSASLGKPRCEADSLRLELGPARLVPKTEDSPLLLALHNIGGLSCTLKGYPRIRLVGATGTVYPFAYRNAGDQEVTRGLPRAVLVRPDATVWALINKVSCVLTDRGRVAAIVRVAPPGSATFLRVSIAASGAYLDYCAAPDPGHRVDVSPIEEDVADTSARM